MTSCTNTLIFSLAFMYTSSILTRGFPYSTWKSCVFFTKLFAYPFLSVLSLQLPTTDRIVVSFYNHILLAWFGFTCFDDVLFLLVCQKSSIAASKFKKSSGNCEQPTRKQTRKKNEGKQTACIVKLILLQFMHAVTNFQIDKIIHQ